MGKFVRQQNPNKRGYKKTVIVYQDEEIDEIVDLKMKLEVLASKKLKELDKLKAELEKTYIELHRLIYDMDNLDDSELTDRLEDEFAEAAEKLSCIAEMTDYLARIVEESSY